MRKEIQLAVAVFFMMITIGCAYHGSSVKTGKHINESAVSDIVKGKTTGSDILTWFGAPTKTSRLGKEELFVYKYCSAEGTHVTVTFIGHSGSKELCDELSVVLDAEGIVKNFSFVKGIKD